MKLIATCSLALLLLLGLPLSAWGCSIAFRTIGPVKVRPNAIERPAFRQTTRQQWSLDRSWTATRPELNQDIVATGGRTYRGASYPKQRALSIDAAAPDDNGWRYEDDADPRTPPCAISGSDEWQQPVILVRETVSEVRVLAVARRTVGDRTGCQLDQDMWGCPTLTRSVVKLKRPLGTRTIRFETFA